MTHTGYHIYHDTHQTSRISQLLFKRLSHRSSMSGISVWTESLRFDRHRCLHVHVTWGIQAFDYTMSRVVLILFKTPCNIKYPLLATNYKRFYSFNAVQNVRSPYPSPSTKALSLQYTCILTGTSGSLSETVTTIGRLAGRYEQHLLKQSTVHNVQ
jgi:hypothetical protein